MKSGARNLIDRIVLEKLKSLNLPASPVASDAEFFRRAFIDTIGVLPTADEVRSFLSDTSPEEKAAELRAAPDVHYKHTAR